MIRKKISDIELGDEIMVSDFKTETVISLNFDVLSSFIFINCTNGYWIFYHKNLFLNMKS